MRVSAASSRETPSRRAPTSSRCRRRRSRGRASEPGPRRGEALAHQRADDLAYRGRVARGRRARGAGASRGRGRAAWRRRRPRARRRGRARCRRPTGPGRAASGGRGPGRGRGSTVSSRAAARAIRDSSSTPLAWSRAIDRVDRLGARPRGGRAAGAAGAPTARAPTATAARACRDRRRRAPSAPPASAAEARDLRRTDGGLGSGGGLAACGPGSCWPSGRATCSAVVEMPWILSLNSSTFDAQRSASS